MVKVAQQWLSILVSTCHNNERNSIVCKKRLFCINIEKPVENRSNCYYDAKETRVKVENWKH
tara:strand:+ start:755 stop:940 length:186 start_codon:yes stop_codon:yes gene_type:complete